MRVFKVLVVDDEVLVRKSVVKLLKREGLESVEAEDGYKAIELASNNDFDLIITDVRMPGITGIEAIKEIKKVKPDLKTIVMTGFASEDTPIEAIRLGVNDYIYKPFELEEFKYCIQRNLKLIQLEEQNKALQDESIKTQKLAAIGNMTSTIVVHDVKNALTTIIGFAKIMKSKKMEEEKTKRFLDIILQQTTIIMEKLKEILEFPRGEMEVNMVLEKIGNIFEDIIKENEVVCEMNGIVFEKNITEELANKEIKVDKRRIKQVFFNLISNAKDALAEREIKKIGLFFEEDAGSLKMKVKDTGKGIPADKIEKIFEPFASFGKQHGTGLGLAIVKQIIEQSAGSISVYSEEGVGTEFIVKIPIV